MSTQGSMTGRVVSNKMNMTVVVSVETRRRAPVYGKLVRRRRKYLAHDGDGVCKVGDIVRLAEARPLSKEKHWRVVEVVKKPQVEAT
ncbi:MAG: 30S ribosomal protein S17 [Chloroflexota bacterium]